MTSLILETIGRGIVIGALVLVPPASGQSAPRSGDPVVPPGGQITAPSRPSGPRVAPPEQLAPTRAIARQADIDDRQVATRRRSAEASPPLSDRDEGRAQALVRIDGTDRCDPAAKDPARAACERPIETRAAEFGRRTNGALSPEQRLLVDRKLREVPASAASAVERIGRNDVDADARDAQVVASVVLPPPAAPVSVTTEVDAALGDAAQGAAVNAVIQAITTGAPR